MVVLSFGYLPFWVSGGLVGHFLAVFLEGLGHGRVEVWISSFFGLRRVGGALSGGHF